jgi:hypothetical protein
VLNAYHLQLGPAGNHQSAVVDLEQGLALVGLEVLPVVVAYHGPAAAPVEEAPVPGHPEQHYLPLCRRTSC